MVEYLLIIISAIFVNNILLSQFLGVCPFLGVSNKLSTATGMSMAVCFVITLATVVTYLLNTLLVKLGLEFLQTISFILVIAALVQMVDCTQEDQPSAVCFSGYLPSAHHYKLRRSWCSFDSGTEVVSIRSCS